MLVSWSGHEFNVYDLGGVWNDVPGVYIFSRTNEAGRWVALYIGQTHSFKDRIPHHEQWFSALAKGITHVHALVEYDEEERRRIESKLIGLYRPPLNSHGLPY